MRRHPHALALFVSLIIFIVHFASNVSTSTDSKWIIQVTSSFVRRGDFDLDEYRALIEANNSVNVEIVNGHIYNYFPIGTAIVAAPFVKILDFVLYRLIQYDLDSELHKTVLAGVEVFIGSILMALASLLLFYMARLYLDSSQALLTMLIFAFCTSAWSTASRALWQHGPSILMLMLTLYLLLLAEKRPYLAQFAALPLAFSYVIRPTNSISIVILTGYVFIRYRRYFPLFLLWAAMIAIPFVAYNESIYGSILPPYYQATRIGLSPTIFTALLGNLISPSRGLFIYSPIMLFVFVGIYYKIRHHEWHLLDTGLVGIIVLHWVAISSFPKWWGGISYGPRFFSDMLPYLMFFLIPVWNYIPKFTRNRAQVAFVSLFFASITISAFIHWRGATSPEPYDPWSLTPTNIDDHPERVWDWRDPQFMRGLINSQP